MSKNLKPSVSSFPNKTVVSLGGRNVTIYPEAGSYRLRWWINGQRYSENFPTIKEATHGAEEILRLRASGREDLASIQKDKLSYYRTCEEALGVPLDIAVRYYLSQNDAKFTATLTPDLVEKFIQDLELRRGKRGVSNRWWETIRTRGRHFARIFPKPIHEITKEELQSAICNPNWGERTQFNFQQIVSIIFGLAKEQNALPAGPTAFDQMKFKLSKPPEKEKEVLSPEHLRKVVAAAIKSGREKFLPALALGAFAGVRTAEINRMKWGVHVDLNQRVLRLTPDITKTARRRLVPMNENNVWGPTLFAWLSKYQLRDGEPLQPYYDHERILTILWKDVAKLPEWPHNALRVSFISYAMVLEENSASIANASGHSEVMLQTVYKQIRGVSEPLAKKWFDSGPDLMHSHALHNTPDNTTRVSPDGNGMSNPLPGESKPLHHHKYREDDS